MAVTGGGVVPVLVMVALNMVAAVMVTLVKVAMDGGMDPLVLVTLQQLTAALFLGPIAYFRERFFFFIHSFMDHQALSPVHHFLFDSR